MTGEEILQKMHRERYITLALADQVTGDRWRELLLPGGPAPKDQRSARSPSEPLLPGGRTIHDLLSHILAWDEWAIGAFEMSLLRELPPTFRAALDDIDAFNARAVVRHRDLPREDLLTGLQTANKRLVTSATAAGGEEWHRRKLPDLAPSPDSPRIPSVGGILLSMINHEASHHPEMSDTYGVSVNLDSGKNGN